MISDQHNHFYSWKYSNPFKKWCPVNSHNSQKSYCAIAKYLKAKPDASAHYTESVLLNLIQTGHFHFYPPLTNQFVSIFFACFNIENKCFKNNVKYLWHDAALISVQYQMEGQFSANWHSSDNVCTNSLVQPTLVATAFLWICPYISKSNTHSTHISHISVLCSQMSFTLFLFCCFLMQWN